MVGSQSSGRLVARMPSGFSFLSGSAVIQTLTCPLSGLSRNEPNISVEARHETCRNIVACLKAPFVSFIMRVVAPFNFRRRPVLG